MLSSEAPVARGQGDFNPARFLAASFAAAMGLGTILLSLPPAVQPGYKVTFLDALFTAASAVCVTGLTVVDTASVWSPFGHIVIALLMQVGGLGVMTGAALIAMSMGRRIPYTGRVAVGQALGSPGLPDAILLVKRAAVMAAAAQIAGMAFLYWRWAGSFGPGRAAFLAFFHSVSAFNNAGFHLFTGSGPVFSGDGPVIFVLSALTIAGGLGFIVLTELAGRARARLPRSPGAGGEGRRERRPLSLQSKITLTMAGGLLAIAFASTALFGIGDASGTAAAAPGAAVMDAFFHGVVVRSAGFPALAMEHLKPAALLVTCFMMFVGGGSGSTAGGVKTSTLAVAGAAVWAALTGREDVTLFRFRLSRAAVDGAVTIISLSAAAVFVLAFIYMTMLGQSFTAGLFHAVSSLGTTGLTLGEFPGSQPAVRLITMVAMFAGRLGPLTMMHAIMRRRGRLPIRYPEGRVIIG